MLEIRLADFYAVNSDDEIDDDDDDDDDEDSDDEVVVVREVALPNAPRARVALPVRPARRRHPNRPLRR